MRWPWSHEPRRRPSAGRLGGLDGLDPATLETIEVDADGQLVPGPKRLGPATAEPAYRPGRDGTGVAGIWSAFVRE
jgi:hypothetical protein